MSSKIKRKSKHNFALPVSLPKLSSNSPEGEQIKQSGKIETYKEIHPCTSVLSSYLPDKVAC